MVWSVFPYENTSIIITHEIIAGIPCLKFKPKITINLTPTIINYHGWQSSKDIKRFDSLTIASYGYQVIVPDALYHGEREPLDHYSPSNLDKYLWKIVLQSIRESNNLIEQIIQKHKADPNRIGIIGESMGAITAGGVFISNPSLKCLVGLIGTFGWEEAINQHHLPIPSNEDKISLSNYDPMNNGVKLKERPMIIMNGTNDTSLPIDSQRHFYDKIIPLYEEEKEKFEFIEISKLDHYITTGMLEKSIMWFKKYL